MLKRREFIRSGVLAGGVLAFGPGFWRDVWQAAANPASPGAGPYGALGPADANGIRLPEGFRSRVIAEAGGQVGGTSYEWPLFPDGAATFPTEDGGWILVVNSEVPPDVGDVRPQQGGASAIRFRADGEIADAYRILGGTNTNCAGGRTPWGTWLSCEEVEDDGRVWECDPLGQRPAVPRPAMGLFKHEAVCVDDLGQRLYLTEDLLDSGFYRFTPRSYPDLSEGVLEIAVVHDDGRVEWRRLPDPSGRETPTRKQVPEATQFRRGEGIWFDSGFVYMSTTDDNKVHAYNTVLEEIEVIYDAAAIREPPLIEPDNVTAAPSGDIYVCEDTGDEDPLDIAIITPEREVARFLKVTGTQHTGAGGDVSSELTGVCFDPSGTRMYFSSQRAFGSGITYEITGPFRTERVDRRPPGIRIESPPTAGFGTLFRRGLPVEILVDEPARLAVAIRAEITRREDLRKPRSQRGRKRKLTIARRLVRAPERGRLTLRLRARRAAREQLRGRHRVLAWIVVKAVDDAGNQTIAVERLRLRSAKARRRRR